MKPVHCTLFVLAICPTLLLADTPTAQPTVSARSIRFHQLKQAGWEHWPAIKELIELGEAEVLQTAITQLRLPEQDWVNDAVEALSLVKQPRLIGLLLSDMTPEEPAVPATVEGPDVQEPEEPGPTNLPAPGPASQVIIAQLLKIPSVPQEVKTWLTATAQVPVATKISEMRIFLTANRTAISESKFALMKTPSAAAQQ